jgi:prepilin-type N-terminal cleavage/methylation domain-containing protein
MNQPQMNLKRGNAGFTLIEILVVILVSAMLTTIVIAYSGTSRDTITLSVKTTTVAQILLRAKSLAVATYVAAGTSHACAYGVFFDPAANTFSMVLYKLPAGTPCSYATVAAAAGANGGDVAGYGSSTWQMPIGPGVHLVAGGASLALFYPPDPMTLLSKSQCSPGGAGCTYAFVQTPMTVTLETDDSSASNVISIGTAGQVDIQ